jgi:cytidylate kinase
MIIAIDGPSGSGKGTLAASLAQKYSLALLDTGLLYRAVGWQILNSPIKDGDFEKIAAIAAGLDVNALDEPQLRSDEVAQVASQVAAIPEVRHALQTVQRKFAQSPQGAVLDGRDIGTVICPDADYKFYLTASNEVRAKRRFNELQSRGIACIYEDVLKELIERDQRDMSRANSPLRPAEDAFIIDTSELTAEEVKIAAMRYIDGNTGN